MKALEYVLIYASKCLVNAKGELDPRDVDLTSTPLPSPAILKKALQQAQDQLKDVLAKDRVGYLEGLLKTATGYTAEALEIQITYARNTIQQCKATVDMVEKVIALQAKPAIAA